MRDFYEEDDEDGENESSGGRMFNFKDLFQSSDDGTIAIEYTNGTNVNRQILETALRMLESSFWWRFRSQSSKMKMLITTYNNIYALLFDAPEDDLEDDDDWLDKEDDDTKGKDNL